MNELMTVKDAMNYVDMINQCADVFAIHDGEIVVQEKTAVMATACLMKFKDIIINASVLFQ